MSGGQDAFYSTLLSQDGMIVLRTKLTSLLGRAPTLNEIEMARELIVGYRHNQAWEFYQTHRGNVDSAISSIARMFAKRPKPSIRGDSEYREYQLDEVYEDQRNSKVVRDTNRKKIIDTPVQLSRIFEFSNFRDLVNEHLPNMRIRSYPVMFANTRNQQLSWYNTSATSASANSHSVFSWTVMPTSHYTQGSVNAQGGELRNIVSIECGNILIPNEFSEHFNEYRRVSMLIRELSSNSMMINDKVRAHFVFDCETIPSDTGSTRVKLINSMPHCDKYVFHVPIAHLSDISISFASPYEEISWAADRDLYPQSLGNASGDLRVTTSYSGGHGLSNGDLVYIEGVTSENPDGDAALIREIEDNRGHVISNVTTATFDIAGIDISSSGINGCTRIIFGSRLFDIPLVVEFI